MLFFSFLNNDIKSCKNHPDCFCYICGECKTVDNRKSITDFVQKAYYAYFGIKLGDQDKPWALLVVCKTCVKRLRQWTSGTRQSMGFGIPMVWRESTNHVDDCYFCSINVTGVNKNKRKSLSYKSFLSAIQPVAHSTDIPIPEFKKLPDLSTDEYSDEEQHDYKVLTDVGDDDEDFACSFTPVLFDQQNLSDLIRDLSLSKESSKVLASRLKDRNLLQHGTKITFYRTRDKEFVPFFDDQLNFVFCKDIPGVLMKLGVTEYSPADWTLFIDSSKRSLKCVLLHITNIYGSIPIGHSTTLKEKYDAIKSVLQHIKYNDHQWLICVDLKMVNNKVATRNTHAFFVTGTAEIKQITGLKRTGQ